jgi:hypothetical protein
MLIFAVCLQEIQNRVQQRALTAQRFCKLGDHFNVPVTGIFHHLYLAAFGIDLGRKVECVMFPHRAVFQSHQ